jgi:hypothetical protein
MFGYVEQKLLGRSRKSLFFLKSWENHHCEKHGNTQISPNLSHKLRKRYAWKILSNQTRPPIRVPGEHQVFYAKSTCLGSNYRNISSLTLVQKVIPGYLQRTVDNYSRAYLWLISHDLSHGVPLMFCELGHFWWGWGQLVKSTNNAFAEFWRVK